MKINNKGKVGVIILIIVLALTSLISTSYIVYDKFVKTTDQKETKNSKKEKSEVVTDKEEKENDDSTTDKTSSESTKELTKDEKEEIARKLFNSRMQEYMENGSKYNVVTSRIYSYNIRSITLQEEIPSDFIMEEGSFVVRIIYDVTPYDINNTYWAAGNGETSEKQIINKSNFYYIVKTETGYEISKAFTGF